MLIYEINTPFEPVLIDIVKNRNGLAIAKLEKIITESIAQNNAPNLLNYVFGLTLLERLDPEHEQHQMPEFLKAHLNNGFSEVIKIQKDIPLLSILFDVIHDLVIESCKEREDLILLDLGMTNIYEMKALLRKLAKKETSLQQITIVSFLHMSGKSTEQIKKNLQDCIPLIPLEFIYLNKHLVEMKPNDWLVLQQKYNNSPIVLMSFTAHTPLRAQHKGYYSKGKVMKQLKAFNPTRLVLIEPNRAFSEGNFIRRFMMLWKHTQQLFSYFDAINLTERQRVLYKMYFRYIIERVIGIKSNKKFQKEETIQNWVDFLGVIGFNISPQSPIPTDYEDKLLNVNYEQGFFNIKFRKNTLAGLVVVS